MNTAGNGSARPWKAGIPVYSAAVVLAGILASLPACAPGGGKTNLLIVSIDSLRTDHVGTYGYQRDTTPVLDRFAEQGAVFLQATAQAPWTTPSITSLMTSLYPSTHGVTKIRSVLDDSAETLAEILRENGYRTGAVIPCATLASFYRLNQGIDDYLENSFGHNRLSSHFLTDFATNWMRRRGGEPFFFWVHYWDPHYNYRPSVEVRGAFVPEGSPFGETFFHIDNVWLEENPLDPPELRYNLDRFDEEILFTDRHLGRLFDFLEDSGLAESTLVVVLADHGEGFQEHGRVGHTDRLFETLVHVPLLLRLPGRIPAGLRVDRLVELIDVLPTVLDLLGIGWDRGGMQGESFSAALIPGTPGGLPPPRPAFSETDRFANLKAIREGEWKYIHDYRTDRGMLYEIASDPGETTDRAGEFPARAAAMRQRLESWGERQEPAWKLRERRLPPEMEERLRSLGYL